MTHATETCLVAVSEKIHAVRLGKLSWTLTVLDLTTALHTDNCKNLLCVLMSHGLIGSMVELCFLSGQPVISDGPSCRLSRGVPQSLVPFLFLFSSCSLCYILTGFFMFHHCYATCRLISSRYLLISSFWHVNPLLVPSIALLWIFTLDLKDLSNVPEGLQKLTLYHITVMAWLETPSLKKHGLTCILCNCINPHSGRVL